MKKKIFKKSIAVVIAGALAVGGLSIPAVKVDAAWTWNSKTSQTGYAKVLVSEVTADSQQNSGEGGSSNGHGKSINATDSDTETYWHTNWSNENEATVENKRLNSNNTITLTLDKATKIAGVTYLPRQDLAGNGVFMQFTIDVQAENSNDWVSAYTQNDDLYECYSSGDTENYANSQIYMNGSDATWRNDEAKAEKEIPFSKEYENIKKVRFTITKTIGSEGFDSTCTDDISNAFISAAELGVLKRIEITDVPTVSIPTPEIGQAVPAAELLPNGYKTVYDKAKNPATLSLGTNFRNLTDTEYSDAFTGSVVAERNGENNTKLDKAAQDKLVIRFRHKADSYPGNGTQIISKVGTSSTEYVLNYNVCSDPNENNGKESIVLYACTPNNQWPQFSYILSDDFWGKWHDITLCFTNSKMYFYVDGGDPVSIDSNRTEKPQNLTLHNGTFKINPSDNNALSFADFKMYTGESLPGDTVGEFATWTSNLSSEDLLFQFGETTVPKSPDYSVASTVWTDASGNTVNTFEGNTDFTATVTLAANGGYKFTDTYKPTTIQVGGSVFDINGGVVVASDASTMIITHTFEAQPVAQEPNATLVGNTLSLDGNIGVNYYVELGEDVTGNTGAYMHFVTDKIDQKVLVSEAGAPVEKADSTGAIHSCYKFTCEVPAKEMCDMIQASIVVPSADGDEDIKVFDSYSVKKYADDLITLGTAEGAEKQYSDAVSLIKSMLNYGGYAQTYFNYTANGVANENLTVDDSIDPSVVTADTLKNYNNPVSNKTTNVTFAGSNLSLLSQTTLRLYFTIVDGQEENVAFSYNGQALDKVKSGNYYYVEITNIAADKLHQDVTVAVTDGSENVDITYNVMTYCYNVLNRNRAVELQNVVKALQIYNTQAYKYIQSMQ